MNARFFGLLLLRVALISWDNVEGFAYAPNFITKIIQEQTQLEPEGLATIPTSNTATLSSEDGPGDTAAATTTATAEPASVSSKVRTRFPPEPNGYLHLGHAKAVSFNFAVARMFSGVCHMRLDDTNPSKEDQEYVDSILEDVRWMQSGLKPTRVSDAEGDEGDPWEGSVRKTSSYFDTIYQCAEALVKSGDAYVDSLSAEEMREYRGSLTEPGRNSPYRERSVEENLQLLQEMKDGKYPDGAHVVRAKIDMASPNINMRDPTLYRIKHESHQETGDEWCLYPMYDFSHPIADALEEITHSLCTLEFEDHRPFYDWTVEKLLPTGLIKAQPQQIEFSRLNVQSTVLSKRKLIQLVQDKLVSGWDDPRMPTISGLRRRGVPAAALRLFCERVGISKADSNLDYGVVEDCIREVMDTTSPRAFCVLQPLMMTIENWDGDVEDFEVDRHPKWAEWGNRTIPMGKQVWIERSDFFDTEGSEGQATGGKPPKGFKRLVPGGRVRLRYAYVVECHEVVRDAETGEPIELKCKYFPDTRAGTTPEGMKRVNGIIHWVEKATAVECTINQYDRLFSTSEPGKESGDYVKDINPNSLQVLPRAFVEPSVAMDALAKLAEIRQSAESSDKVYASSLAYQFERSGYFALDQNSHLSRLVFNRVVTLRDTWGTGAKARGQGAGQNARKRNRGNNGNRGAKAQAAPVEDLRRVALRAATIVSAEPHPEADSLLVCQVDCGDVNPETQDSEPRTVVAGLAGKIPVEELVGQKIVAVTNLKPAKMRGILSHAMLLAASNGGEDSEEVVELLQVPDSVPNGELMRFEGKEESEPDAMMKSKGALKAWDRVKACLWASDGQEAVYKTDDGSNRMMSSGGPITTKSLKESIIQ